MGNVASDPYAVLGVRSDVSDVELRRVYRELVKRHHPDRNSGSPEAAVRFAQIQDAYARVVGSRRSSRTPSADSAVDARIADIEHEVTQQREANLRLARERAARELAEQERAAQRPTQEELGYYTTDDSFTKIIDDATEQLADKLRGGSGKRQFTQRLADLFGRD